MKRDRLVTHSDYHIEDRVMFSCRPCLHKGIEERIDAIVIARATLDHFDVEYYEPKNRLVFHAKKEGSAELINYLAVHYWDEADGLCWTRQDASPWFEEFKDFFVIFWRRADGN